MSSPNRDTLCKVCLLGLFIKGDDITIGRIMQNYFQSVKTRWPKAWDDFGEGAMLNTTNGFRAFMAVFGRIYTSIAAPGALVPAGDFEAVFERSNLKDEDFNTDNFKPGTSGEAKLRNDLIAELFG